MEELRADPAPAQTQESLPETTPEPEITEDSAAAPEVVEVPVAAPPVTAVKPVVPAAAQAPELFKDASWLLRQNPERYTLQMLTLSSRQRAVQFINRQQNQEEFALYSWQREGARLYVVTYGVFSGSDAARRTAESFGGEPGRINPWVRSMRLVQETIRNNPQD